jgi:hypothetical protein
MLHQGMCLQQQKGLYTTADFHFVDEHADVWRGMEQFWARNSRPDETMGSAL